jgi:flagellar motor component MotA
MRRRHVLRELILEGLLAIVDRTNPRILEERLTIYLHESERPALVTLAA